MLRISLVLGLLSLLHGFAQAASGVLEIEQAVALAVERDAGYQSYAARSAAYQQQAIADRALPDPRLKLALMDRALNEAAREEDMSQYQIGLQQMFPAGRSLRHRGQISQSLAGAEDSLADDQRRKLMRDVRQLWLEWYYWHAAHQLVTRNRASYAQLVNITSAQYAAGRQPQQVLLRAELELGLLDDRLVNIRNRIETATAGLIRYLGAEHGEARPASAFPRLPQPAAEFVDHPLLQAAEANVDAAHGGLELARQSYKPSWMLDVTYGRDGKSMAGQRGEYVSAMLVVDIPLFTGNLQDRQVAASKLRHDSALHNLEDRQRELQRQWQSALAQWRNLDQRLARYEQSLIPMARENATAARLAYQSRSTDFNNVMQASIMQLETELSALRLQVEHAQSQAQLLYLTGE